LVLFVIPIEIFHEYKMKNSKLDNCEEMNEKKNLKYNLISFYFYIIVLNYIIILLKYTDFQ